MFVGQNTLWLKKSGFNQWPILQGFDYKGNQITQEQKNG